MSSVTSIAVTRLRKDYMKIKKDPVPFIAAEPLPSNILEWHYVIHGPPDTPYHGGIYHGRIKFPPEFPFRPPSIYMITPNGRFKTNFRLCLSMSDYHPDTWNPSWTVSTILAGLLSFMLESTVTLGSLDTNEDEKKELAQRTADFNLRDPIFAELFPEICEECKQLSALRSQMDSSLQSAGRDSDNSERSTGFWMRTRLGRYFNSLKKRARRGGQAS